MYCPLLLPLQILSTISFPNKPHATKFEPPILIIDIRDSLTITRDPQDPLQIHPKYLAHSMHTESNPTHAFPKPQEMKPNKTRI